MALTQTPEEGLKVSNAPSDGKYLQYKDSTDKLTWTDVPAGVGGATGVDFNDGVEIRLGTSNDAVIDYDGTGNELLLKTSTTGSNITIDGKSYVDLNLDGATQLLISPTAGIQCAKDITILGPDASTGAKLILSEDSGLVNNEATIQASNAMTADVQITLPAANPTSNGLSLTATTAGVTSWATPVIPDNSVTGAKIALGSDASGDIMYNNGTDYVRLAKGTDDQVLTLASGVPSWAAAGGGAFSKAYNDNGNTQTTVNKDNDSPAVRIGGTGLELEITPPSNTTSYLLLIRTAVHANDNNGQWGMKLCYSTDNWSNQSNLTFMHNSYGYETTTKTRYNINQWRTWTPGSTSTYKIGLFAEVWSTDTIELTFNGHNGESSLSALEISDATKKSGNW